MTFEPLMLAGVSDFSGRVRGKGYPLADQERRLAGGVGWTPANALITCFHEIAPSRYGSFGDLVIRPAREAQVCTGEGETDLRFTLGDIVDLDAKPWACCTRSLAREAVDRLERLTGCRALMAFEHEFVLEGGAPNGGGYSMEGFVAEQAFAGQLTATMRAAGLSPDTFLREFGRDQYEVTIDPALGIAAADQAVILREVVRHVARLNGRRASFAAVPHAGGIGNGVHVHVSLRDAQDRPVMYDPAGKEGMSALAGSFVAGILRALPAIVALSAPSVASYYRLAPNRWSAAFNNLGARDREAAVRICPLTGRDDATRARQFNVEYRAADATASPYLVVAALLQAGCQGIEDGLAAPDPTCEPLDRLGAEALAARGLARLPTSLDAALAAMREDAQVASWFPAEFLEMYEVHKRGEMAFLEGRDEAAICAAYKDAY